MTVRNLDALFNPKAIALVGASNQPNSVGAVLVRNLTSAGFTGRLLMVNPHEETIDGLPNFRSVADLPVTPDLAVIATPPPTVPGLIADLGAKGCRAAVVITAGFGEGGRAEGQRLRQAMLDASRPYLLRIVGPNCIGCMSPAQGINASFAHLNPAPGDIAFVTQSGALATAVLDWASAGGYGFSHVISVGDMADVDFGDLLDYLALDRETRGVLLYIESVEHARKFMSAGRAAARAKPVVVIKSGRSGAGANAALSHTGALAGSDLVYDAAFRRAGMLRVMELRQLFEAVTTLSSGIDVKGDRLTILTNGGGAGVLAADALDERGGHLARLHPDTMAALDQFLPNTWSHGNPVDILGDATGDRYRRALATLNSTDDSDAILVMNCPTAVTDSTAAARAVVETLNAGPHLPALTCWLGESVAADARRLFSANRVPTFETPDDAVRAFSVLVDYRRNQDLLLQVPPADRQTEKPGRATVRRLISDALAKKKQLFAGAEAKAVLEAYGIPTVGSEVAYDPAGAAAIARRIGRPVALKILSPEIIHKSDVGGVRLNLSTPTEVEEAARAMLESVGKEVPQARISGFIVERMANRPNAHELLCGISEDKVFGPVILFGQGGTATEVIRDRSIGLPPLNVILARDMIARTRISALLAGYRDHPPVDLVAVARTLTRLSELAVDFPEIAELDINPLLADGAGVVAVDARIVVRDASALLEDRLALPAYPADLEHETTTQGGFRVTIRPIRPDDEPLLVRMVDDSSEEDRYFRFLSYFKGLPHPTAARMSQIDYDREMALVALVPVGAVVQEMVGVARLIADPDNQAAEYAVMVRSDMKGRGIGYRLMADLIEYARTRGLKRLSGSVLRHNHTMLSMTKEFGFKEVSGDDPSLVAVTKDLTES